MRRSPSRAASDRRSAVDSTDRAGTYRLPALTPGDYEVAVTARGFRLWKQNAAILRPGATATIDVTLIVAGVVEATEVTPDPPSGLDVYTSAAVAIIPRDVLDNLPLNRSVSSFVNLVPGVVKDVAFGGSRSANPIAVDGANGNEPGWGVPVAAPSASWIEQLQIVTLGADAQFGEYTGAFTNALTRSGANRLCGEVNYWTTRPSSISNNRRALTPDLASRFRPLDLLDRWTLSAQLGGPVRKNALWFFGATEFYRDQIRPAGFASVASPPEDAVFSLREPKVFGKLTAATKPSIRWEGYVARNQSKSRGANASPLVKPEALTADHWRQTLWNIRMTWLMSDRSLPKLATGATTRVTAPGRRIRPRDPAPHRISTR